MRRTDLAILILPVALLSGCSFNFELTSSRTALENQIMGTYKELDDELIVTNADRNKVQKGNDERMFGDSAVARATRNRAFNADDIAELKDDGIIGEMPDAKISLLPKESKGVVKASPEQVKLAEALIDEENKDRSALISAEVAKSQNPGKDDVKNARENFARDIFEKAPKGHWFNTGEKWQQKY